MSILLDCHGNKLGDKNVQNAEGVAKLREQVKKLAATKKIPNQDLLENADMALGTPMSPSLFIEKLRKLPGVIVEQGGIPNAVAVRTLITDQDKESDTFGQPIKKYVGGFYVDRILPEFSQILSNSIGLPVREIRGWRTVLLQLFHAKVVTLSQLTAAFGDANGQRSKLWQEQTQKARV